MKHHREFVEDNLTDSTVKGAGGKVDPSKNVREGKGDFTAILFSFTCTNMANGNAFEVHRCMHKLPNFTELLKW